MDCIPTALRVVLLSTAIFIGLICVTRSIASPPATNQATTSRPDVQVATTLRPELIVQAGHTSRVTTLSFSADDKLLATCSGEGGGFSLQPTIVKLWDV